MSAPAVVLVVDDNDDVLLMASFQLQVPGSVVVCASDGTEAARLVAERDPAVIVMDYKLEREIGTDVARDLVADGYAGTVFIYTAHVTGEVTDEATQLGLAVVAKTDFEGARQLIIAAITAVDG